MLSLYSSTIKTGFQAVTNDLDRGRLLWLLGLISSSIIAVSLAKGIWRTWYHPLSKYPGPKLLSVIDLPYLYKNYVGGTWTRGMIQLHRQYGNIVRIGPNHLAVDGALAWPEIFGYRGAGREEYGKIPPPFPQDSKGILNAPQDVHRRQRRQLAHAFSDSALVKQEATIAKYIDLLLSRLEQYSINDNPVNIVEWFNFTTFDIIGDLVFSESFSSLDASQYHPWVRSIFEGFRGTTMRRFFHSYPLFEFFASWFNLGTLVNTTLEIRSHAREKTKARMDFGLQRFEGRADFMTYMLRKNRDGETSMNETEILTNSPTLVVAGSETTATALSGFCFFVGRHPDVYATLAEEIHSTFRTDSDVTMTGVASLQYLGACINEVLRLYPPIAETPSRVSPGGWIDGNYVPAGTQLTVYQWATFRNPQHFRDPDSFIPERWLPKTHKRYNERFEDENHSVFKPFSFGSRDCIGKNLAFAELRLIIARLLSRFDFELLPGQDDWHNVQRVFIVWEKGPLYIRVRQLPAA